MSTYLIIWDSPCFLFRQLSTITPVLLRAKRKIKTFFFTISRCSYWCSYWCPHVAQSVGNTCVSYPDLPSTFPVPVQLSLMPSRSYDFGDVSEENGPDRHDPKTIGFASRRALWEDNWAHWVQVGAILVFVQNRTIFLLACTALVRGKGDSG